VITLTLINTTSIALSLKDLAVYFELGPTPLMSLAQAQVSVPLLAVYRLWPHSWLSRKIVVTES